MPEKKDKNELVKSISEDVIEESGDSESQYKGTGSLKFGTGFPRKINDRDCWFVPGLGFYTSEGKYIGESEEEASLKLTENENSI